MNFRLCCTTGTGSFLKRPNLRQNKFLMSYIPYAKVKSVSIITQTFPTFGRRSLSSITIKSQSGLVTRISKTECRLNVFHARKSQSQHNFTTCRPSLLAKEIKRWPHPRRSWPALLGVDVGFSGQKTFSSARARRRSERALRAPCSLSDR